MSFLLKIVEGPNKGAEIALVDGVSVTLGKGDDCDIVLADTTLPDEPLSIAASADSVSVGGEPVEPLAVRTVGATSFAIGPADAPWGELKWKKPDVPESPEKTVKPGSPDKPEQPESPEKPDSPEKQENPGGKRRAGCCGCIVALLILLVVLLGLAWFFRDRLKESDRYEQFERMGRDWYSRIAGRTGGSGGQERTKTVSLSDIAEKYGLSLVESDGRAVVSGNFRTRRERLSATAEAYEAQPGVDLDLSDDESFRASAEDALFTLTEGALKVVSATNRVLSIAGSAPSPQKLKRVLTALNADLARLRGVDVSRVILGVAEKGQETAYGGREDSPLVSRASRHASKKPASPALPVCGILTTPYPCLVMRDGRRIMEGAAIADSVIVEIGADSVTLTNSTGRFTWRP